MTILILPVLVSHHNAGNPTCICLRACVYCALPDKRTRTFAANPTFCILLGTGCCKHTTWRTQQHSACWHDAFEILGSARSTSPVHAQHGWNSAIDGENITYYINMKCWEKSDIFQLKYKIKTHWKQTLILEAKNKTHKNQEKGLAGRNSAKTPCHQECPWQQVNCIPGCVYILLPPARRDQGKPYDLDYKTLALVLHIPC